MIGAAVGVARENLTLDEVATLLKPNSEWDTRLKPAPPQGLHLVIKYANLALITVFIKAYVKYQEEILRLCSDKIEELPILDRIYEKRNVDYSYPDILWYYNYIIT